MKEIQGESSWGCLIASMAIIPKLNRFIRYVLRNITNAKILIMRDSLLLHSMDLCCKYMQSHPGRNVGLVSGETALLLCFYYFYKKSNHYECKRLMLQLAEEQLEGINDNFDLSSGLSSLCLVFHWIKQDCLLKDQLEEIDLLIEREYNLSLNKNDMDYFHGASGYIFYFLMTNRCKRLDILLSNYIQQVNDNFNSDNWYTPFYQKNSSPTMVVNIGTPHGITGVLLILLIALEKGYQFVTPTITRTCDFLLTSRFAEMKKSFFPSFIKQNGEKIDSGIAWCYGDLMASYAILKTGVLLRNSYYMETGYRMLLQLNERTDYIKNDLCLCHGHSSLIVIYKRIYEMTRDKLFFHRCLFWYEETNMLLETQMNNRKGSFFETPSLFIGFPGAFLSLLTCEFDDCKWTKCLLL